MPPSPPSGNGRHLAPIPPGPACWTSHPLRRPWGQVPAVRPSQVCGQLLGSVAGQACSRVAGKPGQPGCKVAMGQGPGAQPSLGWRGVLGPAGLPRRPWAVPVGPQVHVLPEAGLLGQGSLVQLVQHLLAAGPPGCRLGGWGGRWGGWPAVPGLQADAGRAQVLAQALQVPAEARLGCLSWGRGSGSRLGSGGGWPAAVLRGRAASVAMAVCTAASSCQACACRAAS